MHKRGTIEKMTPGSAIRAFCVSCCGGVLGEVKTCDGDGTDPAYYACPFHPYRLGRGRPSVKIIRKHCLQCMGDSPSYVRECDTMDCPCHQYRMGKNPALFGRGQNADQMALVRSKKQHVAKTFEVQNQRSAME